MTATIARILMMKSRGQVFPCHISEARLPKIIEVRDDLTVIVLYTDDMRESAMQNILGEMLPELQA